MVFEDLRNQPTFPPSPAYILQSNQVEPVTTAGGSFFYPSAHLSYFQHTVDPFVSRPTIKPCYLSPRFNDTLHKETSAPQPSVLMASSSELLEPFRGVLFTPRSYFHHQLTPRRVADSPCFCLLRSGLPHTAQSWAQLTLPSGAASPHSDHRLQQNHFRPGSQDL